MPKGKKNKSSQLDTVANSEVVTSTPTMATNDDNVISLPIGMPLEAAANVLNSILAAAQEADRTVTLFVPIHATPYDGAYALGLAMQEMFGVAIQDEDMRGNRRRTKVASDAHGGTVDVAWGNFRVPAIEGSITTSYTQEDGQIIFEIAAEIKGKYRAAFDQLVTLTKRIVSERSLYRGKAIDVQLTDRDNDRMSIPNISFIDVENAPRPIFDEDVDEQLEFDVLYYIKQAKAIRERRGSVKRGILLAGEFGVGKTMLAKHAAKVATEHGFTFIYIRKPTDFPHALDFARPYQPAVVFIEDLEKAAGRNRTKEVDLISLKMDGVDTKRIDVITMATTNNLGDISEVLRRPGRFDFTLMLRAPQAKAALQIASHYAGQEFPYEEFAEAAKQLAGQIPAVIEEGVARAKNRADAGGDNKSVVISPRDLLNAALSVRAERELHLDKASPDAEQEFLLKFAWTMGDAFGNPLSNLVETLLTTVAHNPATLTQLARRQAPAIDHESVHANGHDPEVVR